MSRNKKVAAKYQETKDDKAASRDPKYKARGKGSKRRDREDKNYDTRRGSNSLEWYVPDVQMLNDAGRWPWSRPVGTPLSRNSILGIADRTDSAIPGMLAIGLINTPGPSVDGSSAINVAASAQYTYVRHVNAGSRNYDSNDLMIYVMAMDSIYSIVSWITRIYATVGMYASMNKYLPTALGSAQLNVDLDSIRDNMANFRTRVNALILKIGALVVPATMPIFQRHAWIYQNYFSEGDNIKDQLYFFYPLNLYKFQLDSTGAGMLKSVSLYDYQVGGKITADGLVKMLEDMINPIFNDEDFNIMGGDILKAYEGNIMRLMLLPDLLIAQPVYNPEVLFQIKNSRCFPMYADTNKSVFDVTQDVNKEFLQFDVSDFAVFKDIQSPTVKWDSNASSDPDVYRIAYDEASRPAILTSTSSDVTPGENMINTRLTDFFSFHADATAPAGLVVDDLAFGSEITCALNYIWNENGTIRSFRVGTVNTYDATSNTALEQINLLQSVMSSFRYHPAHSFVGYDKSSSPTSYITSTLPNFGVDNFTTIDFDHINDLHTVAILGEFNVPRLAIVK